MDLFETLGNEKFFNPLVGPNKKVYFECITELIEYSKKMPVLYKDNVKDTLEIFLRNKTYRVETEDLDSNFDEGDADKIIRKFQECSWLTEPELGRNGEYITNIAANCRRLIDFLNSLMNRKNDAAISNRILSMDEILKSAYSTNSVRKDRPYSSILVPLMENEAELKNEVLDLKDSISIIMSRITEINDLSGIGHYLLSDQFLEKFFKDYFYMKNNGLIPAILRDVAQQLSVFKHDTLFKKAIQEYSVRMDVEEEEAEEQLTKYIDEIYFYITVEYPEYMERIDESINKYFRLANLRLRLVTSNGQNIQSLMDQILMVVKESNKEEQQIILEKLNGCIQIESQKYISRKSYQHKKHRRLNEGSAVVETKDLSEEEKMRITNELMKSSINPYSVERTERYFANLFKVSGMPYVKSGMTKSKEEALMFVSAFIYSGDENFGFIVETEDGTHKTPVGIITNMKVKRKK